MTQKTYTGKVKVCVTRKIPGPGIDLLQQAGFEVAFGMENVAGAEAILSLLTDKIDGSVMDAAGKQLKIVANYAVGFDNIDLEAAKQRNIFVTNTPGGFETAVAEHTIALLLAVARHVVQGDGYVRAGKYVRWEPELFVGMELKGKNLGIIGMGRIGLCVARMAKFGFGMNVLYHAHSQLAGEQASGLEAQFFDDLEKMLAVTDVLSLHVPLTLETKHMIAKKELSGMKKTAILVNTSRGAVVDEMALCEALKEGWISGAGLDVFEDETQVISESEKILYSLPNVVLTPHIGSATMEARSEMSRMAAENIIAALSGQAPPNVAK